MSGPSDSSAMPSARQDVSPGEAVAGFAPPPYPYERLNGAKARATERFAASGGLVANIRLQRAETH